MLFRTSDVNKVKEGNFIKINGPVHQEKITLNWNATKSTLSKYTKQKLIEVKEKIDKSLLIAGDFKTRIINWWNKWREYQEGYR